MGNFPLFIGLTTVMGLSIFLSLPVVYSRRAQGRWAVGLNAAAIGILVFMLADVFSNASTILYPTGYVANLGYSVAFGTAFLGAFLALFLVDNVPRKASPAGEGGPRLTALIIALGIALQNVSEGFPIAAPFLGTGERRGLPMMFGLFLIGGVPTVLGGAIGYFWSSSLFLVIFDALAIGALAYVILSLMRVAFRVLDSREASIRRNRIVYIGALVGFLIGFAVNAI